MTNTTWPKVWVVEMRNPETGEWEPVVGACLTRRDAIDEQHAWEKLNPDDRFRAWKYEAVRRD